MDGIAGGALEQIAGGAAGRSRVAGPAVVEIEVRREEEAPEVFFVLEPVRVVKPVRTVQLD